MKDLTGVERVKCSRCKLNAYKFSAPALCYAHYQESLRKERTK
jgi:hypothetical protein